MLHAVGLRSCRMQANATPYIWVWGAHPIKRALDRKDQRCRVICRGTMNSALVEFEDGYRSVVSRNGLRKTS